MMDPISPRKFVHLKNNRLLERWQNLGSSNIVLKVLGPLHLSGVSEKNGNDSIVALADQFIELSKEGDNFIATHITGDAISRHTSLVYELQNPDLPVTLNVLTAGTSE